MEKLNTEESNDFFTKEFRLDDVFTREDFSEAHRVIADKARGFVERDVLPVMHEIEKQHFPTIKRMIRKSAEEGLLGVNIAEAFGGTEGDKISGAAVAEKLGRARSFSITFSGQIGIGSLPIVYFGTEEQKKKYLPQIASGEKIGAFALTEPNAGTDVLGLQTTARLSNDRKSYILNGRKQFITNASIADVFIIFARIDGCVFTAFIVDKETEGFSVGKEENLMGIKGSSTAALHLHEVKVPVENVLGEIGRGHLIAFNILNLGRNNLAANCLGISKRAMELAVDHTNARRQFKKSLADFPLTKAKITDMKADIFAMESMIYRTAGEITKEETYCRENQLPFVTRLKSYAMECAINKVFASERQGAIIDEALQLHGGYGYIGESEIATHYRDARITRIFEGTNEINRITIANAILRRNDSYPVDCRFSEDVSARFTHQWESLGKLRTFTAACADYMKTAFENPVEEQELAVGIADLAILAYALESSLIRVEKILRTGTAEEFRGKKAMDAGQAVKQVKAFAAKTMKQSLMTAITFAEKASNDKVEQQLHELNNWILR